jgi:hypothetical protein
MKKSLVAIMLFSCFLISCKDNQLEKREQVKKTTNDEIIFIEPKEIQSYKKLEEFLKTSFYKVEEIDFTGDKIPDFICKGKPNSNGQGIEYWINSDFKMIRKDAYYLDGFTHRRFANLDKDIEPEIFETEGDKDWIGYTFYDLNLETGKKAVLLYFNPIINDNNNNYWVTPENKVNIHTRNNNNEIELFCSLKTPILNEEDEDLPKDQKYIPVIYFQGQHNSNILKQNIDNNEWLSLNKIISLTKK